MIEPVILIISTIIGTIIGLGFFAGLWITTQLLPDAKRPVLLWVGSALLRFGGATVVFYILLSWGQSRAEGFDSFAPVLAGLAGFVIARFASTAIWGPGREPKMPTGGDSTDREQPDLRLESDQEDEGEADQ